MAGILEQFSVVSDETDYDFCSGFGELKYWKIPKENLGNFWGSYCSAVYESDEPEFNIREKLGGISPVIFDMKLSFDKHKTDHLDGDVPYTWRFILYVIQTIQDTLFENFEVTMEDLECVVCISDKYINDQSEDYFIRLQFPNCRLDLNYQSNIFLEKILSQCHQKGIIKYLDKVLPCNHLSEMFLPINRCPYVNLYYSKFQDANEPVMEKTYILPVIRDPDEDPEELDIDWPHFSISNHKQIDNFDLANFTNLDNKDFWLPLFLSLDFGKDITYRKPSFEKEEDAQNAHILEKLLPYISAQRFNVECDWLAIGQAIKNTFFGSTYGLILWYNYSSKYGYDYEHCKKLYESFGCSYYTVKTVAWFVSIDSRVHYQNFTNEWLNENYKASLSITESDVARMFYIMFWLKFVCSGARSNMWYIFENHHWEASEEGMEVSKYITGKFVNWYEFKDAELSLKIAQPPEGTKKEDLEAERSKVQTLIKKLKSASFETGLMKKLKVMFYSKKFIHALDSNDSLLGTPTGVLEMTSNNIFFRAGKPEDYISKHTGVLYDQSLHEGHEVVIKAREYFSQVFVDRQVREYFFRDVASMMRGKNSHKLFRVWTDNRGDNSKSICQKILTRVFGDYAKDVPVTILTNPNFNPSSAAPEIADLLGVRIAFASEPENGQKVRTGTLKRLTGGDRIRVRRLFENGGSIDAFFNIILVCNDIPEFDKVEDAVDNRFRPIPFESQWVNDAPETPEEQYRQKKFKKDPNFDSEHVPDIARGLLWLLVKYYPIFLKENLTDIPESMKMKKINYYNGRVIYNNYVSKCIDTEAKSECRLTESQLYNHFDKWYRAEGKNLKDKPTKDDVIDAVKKIIKNPKTGVAWQGCAIRADDSIL